MLTSTSNPRFRRYRKLFHSALNKERVKDFTPIQEKSMAGMLLMVLRKPEDFRKHIRYVMGATITKITYDYDMALENDPFVKLAESSADNFSKASQPGQWMVDMIPIREYSARPWQTSVLTNFYEFNTFQRGSLVPGSSVKRQNGRG